MKLIEISLQYFPPKIIATCMIDGKLENFDFPIPRQYNTAKEIFNYLTNQNKLFTLYKAETKHFSKSLATSQVKNSKFKLKKTLSQHVSPIVQILITKANSVISIGQDCQMLVISSQTTCIDLDSRPICCAENGLVIAVALLSKEVKFYDFSGKFSSKVALKSCAVSMRYTDAKQLIICCFEGSVFSLENDAKTLLAKHPTMAISCYQYSPHKYYSASVDGIVGMIDLRALKASARLSAQSKASVMNSDCRCTGMVVKEKTVICGFESGEFKVSRKSGQETGKKGSCVRGVDITADGEVYAILDEFGVECSTGASFKVQNASQIQFLNPRENQKLVIAGKELIIWNIEKDKKVQFDCGEISCFQTNYDGTLIVVGDFDGKLYYLSSE